MVNHPIGATICALIAAVLFAVAAVAQQNAAAAVPEREALVRALVRNPRWWAGIVGDAGGYTMQVAALALGAVLLVQPILVSALIFALPLSARLNGIRVTARTTATALALTAALVCFLVVGNPTEGNSGAPLRHWLVPLIVLLAFVTVAVVLGSVAGASATRALLLGTASGSLYGLAAALTADVTHLFDDGIAHVLGSWQTWALIVAGLLGVYWQQRAFHAGSLAASLPAVTIAEPLAAAFIGLTVLGEHFRTGTLGLIVVALTVLVMCVTTVALSRTQAAAEASRA
ncbi:DMT family transporter [Nocardia callitridis]|uniref:DMT family transporter n=1 Tax=Nocardia callitridis TaxID=648753 RepID=A0ABP9K1M1_9NOCA